MKKSIFLLMVMLIATIAIGRNNSAEGSLVAQPRFMGYYPISISEYLRNNINLPDYKKGIQGTVVVSFIVTTEGKLKDFEVINKVYHKYEYEVIHALKGTSGKWMPATVNGQPVDMRQEVIFAFKPNPQIDFKEKAKNYAQKANLALFVRNKSKKALKLYDLAITLQPYDQSLLAMRAFCKNKMGDHAGANKDMDRLKVLAEMAESGTPLLTDVDTGKESNKLVRITSEVNGVK